MTMALLLTTFMDIGKTSMRNILDLIFCLPVRQELLSIKIFSLIIIFYKIQNLAKSCKMLQNLAKLAKSENLADSCKGEF